MNCGLFVNLYDNHATLSLNKDLVSDILIYFHDLGKCGKSHKTSLPFTK